MTLDNSNSLLSTKLEFKISGFGKQIDGICNVIENDRADVLTFQEVSEKHSKDFFQKIGKTISCAHLHYPWKGTKFDSGKWIRHGVLIAAKHRMEVMGKWIDQAKFPDLFAHVKIFSPNFPKGIEFVTAHIPNGSGYGWIKVEHFRILSKALIESPDSPRILTGDFNEPRHSSHTVKSFPLIPNSRKTEGLKFPESTLKKCLKVFPS